MHSALRGSNGLPPEAITSRRVAPPLRTMWAASMRHSRVAQGHHRQQWQGAGWPMGHLAPGLAAAECHSSLCGTSGIQHSKERASSPEAAGPPQYDGPQQPEAAAHGHGRAGRSGKTRAKLALGQAMEPKFIASEELGGAKQDNGSVRREASRMRECFSPQVTPEGLDMPGRDVGRRRKAEEFGEASLRIKPRREQQGTRAILLATELRIGTTLLEEDGHCLEGILCQGLLRAERPRRK